MSFGKPVIATNYSGNLEFMNAENSFLVDFKLVSLSIERYYYGRNQVWAEPNISHAASLMHKVKSNNHLSTRIIPFMNKNVFRNKIRMWC